MKYFITIAAFLVIALLVFGILTKLNIGRVLNSNIPAKEKALENTTNKLLTSSNLEEFFCRDYTDNPDYLSAHKLSSEKKVKSVSIYRHSTGGKKYLLTDSIILNKRGKPVMSFRHYESDSFFRTYFFYDNIGNRYLDIVTAHYNDTIYTLRKFDQFNHIWKEINYNVARKEDGQLLVFNIVPVSDSLIKLNYESFDSDLEHKNILPFETRDITIKQLNDSSVQTSTNRIVHRDTIYNSSDTESYRIEDNTLIPFKNKSISHAKEDPNWIEKKIGYFDIKIKRVFNLYKPEEAEIQNDFPVNQSIVNVLSIKMDSFPILAWKKYRENRNALSKRKKILKDGLNIDRIELQEGNTINKFTPQLWYLVSQDSGYIKGFSNKCFVVGYNTPLKNKKEFNTRCLAIYERRNGKYTLKKQSFGALEDFVDHDNNLLFNEFNETDFSVHIEEGNIVVNYDYMRGEASYIFTCEKGNWILVNYESGHRTCCEAELTSYNYKTKKYSYSVTSTSEDASKDTSITTIQERPVMYMDSINIRDFDYSETGLLVK